MILYSTEHKSPNVSLEEAIFRGLPPDNGLYMPTEIKPLPASFFDTIQDRSLPEMAIAVCENLLGDSLSSEEIKKIIGGRYEVDAEGDISFTPYKVKRGDTLYVVAKRFNVEMQHLKRWNPGAGKALKPGQMLTVYQPH